MKNLIAVCPGSFDPITNGHIDIIYRASKIFDEVVLLITNNSTKNYFFTVEERMLMAKNASSNIANVKVDYCDVLLAEYVKKFNRCCLVKGLRAVTDYEYEFQHAITNKILNSELETIYINASNEYMYLSSSVVKQVAELKGDISIFVDKQNLKIIEDKFKNRG